MTSYEEQIAEYMESRSPNPLGYKNISHNTGIPRKHVFRTLVNSDRFIRVDPLHLNSGSLGLTIFKLSD
jgi:hypothetical protein